MENLQEVIDGIINPTSPFYEQEIVDLILEDYATIEHFKMSEEYKSLIGFNGKEFVKTLNNLE